MFSVRGRTTYLFLRKPSDSFHTHGKKDARKRGPDSRRALRPGLQRNGAKGTSGEGRTGRLVGVGWLVGGKEVGEGGKAGARRAN